MPDSSLAKWDKSFFGHPRGLSTMFFTEMWERFSYYGMRALLILFMTAAVTKGGLGFPTSKAGAIYGMYTSMVYLLGLPGGWVADRILGQRKAVLWGGIFIAAGEFALATPRLEAFYLGLVLITIGTGLLKPNISTMVGGLYSEKDVRRDAGFSIFYMGINVGALIAPLVCGYLGENIDWHYGFLAAGICMVLGLVQYVYGWRFLAEIGMSRTGTAADFRVFRLSMIGAAVAIAVLGGLTFTGAVTFTADGISDVFGVLLALIVILTFAGLLRGKSYSHEEKSRFWAILVLFIASALFWSAFEQAGSTLNLFADRNTNLHAWDFPLWGQFRASYYQSFNSAFMVFGLAPAFAWLWVKLGKNEPSSTAKFSIGLLFVGLGFLILIPVATGTSVSPWWLTLTYLLHTIGEMCLSPVGLSAMTKLAPQRVAGMIMGVWFVSIAVGNYIGGRLASVYESFPLPMLFGVVVAFCFALALVLLFLIKPMRRLMGDVN